MSKEIYISSTPQETRLAIVEKEELSEIYYERENEYTLAGSIYNGRVTRVLPGMQSAFVDVGLERDAFLYITDFLEEQGEDSAEFEGGSGGEPRRESRDRGGERGNDRGGRGDRSRGGERNGRGREQEPREAIAERPPTAERPLLADRQPVAEPGESQELGSTSEKIGDEGDDTAEGSRRWRGRRGRRRGGRSGEDRGPVQAAGESIVIEGESAGLSAEEAEGEPLERIFGQAGEAAQVEEALQAGQREPNAAERAPAREGRREERTRDGRDRGGRDRGGRGRDRGGERERDRSPERHETGGNELQAGAEPLILPGESLSRYRRGEEAQGETAASVAAKPKPVYLTARPSTEINLAAAGWDGGTVMPGETLSRRRGASEPTAAAPAPRTGERQGETQDEAEGNTGAGRRRDRDRQRGRSGRAEGASEPVAVASPGKGDEEATPTFFRSGAVLRESLDAMEAVQPGVSSEHGAEATPLPLGISASGVEEPALGTGADASPAEDVIYEPVTDVAEPSAEPSPALLEAVQAMHAGLELEPTHAGEEFQEEVQEYEPGEEAAASYRVDPAGPSDFRQGGGTDDAEESEGDPAVQGDYAGSEHQLTIIENTGEMLSELPGEIAVDVPNEDPTNPIEHETAVLTERASKLLGATQAPSNQVSEAAGQAFAPGAGYLEEELLDDDESELLDVAASYGDDTEEETFEAGAEIGSLARERVLDELTQVDGSLLLDDEDEDFDHDEEELEEDELEGNEEIAASDLADIEEDELFEGETAMFEEEGDKPAAASMGAFPEFAEEPTAREPRRGGAEARAGDVRREPRRGEVRGGERSPDRGGDRVGDRVSDRGGDRERGARDRGDRGGRDRRGMAGSRSGGRGSRHSMQTTDLPAISDLLKPGQEVLVQIAKEPIAKKGARITSHIALPGRFLVFMPTVNHVGVSRKIESDGERRRLKEILLSEKGEAGGGFIVRTAAMGASEEELRSDLRFLLNLWADIKSRSESSKSPALIYHDLNLVERVLRDQVSENFSAIWCDTESEYERVLRFLQRFEPSLMRRVKLYTKDTPLFEQFGISEEINKALRSKVWLKSGGSIVINQTEALVAIDINTGKYVGKTARLEDTIVKTNLDAIPEIVRQIRLRDLGGIIVIDFIDMDDRKNRQKVLLALEDELKKDRAPSKVLQFNDFGLVAITRKRVKQSLERTLSTTCGICAGTGMVKSPVTVCNEIYIELRKMHRQLDKGDVMLRVNPEVVKQLKANNAKWLGEMEEIAGKTILVKSDPSLHPEQFDIH